MLTLSSSVPTPSSLVSLLLELDIHLPTDRNALVVDHFNYDTLSASEPRSAYSYNPKDDIEGVEDPFAVGPQLSLITTMQARNSARFTVIGSAEMLEDKWFDAKVKRSVGMGGAGSDAKTVSTANQEFIKEVTGWTFGEIGVLQVFNIEHYLNESGVRSNVTNPKIYRVKNDVVRLSLTSKHGSINTNTFTDLQH